MSRCCHPECPNPGTYCIQNEDSDLAFYCEEHAPRVRRSVEDALKDLAQYTRRCWKCGAPKAVHPVLADAGSTAIRYICQACQDAFDAETREIDELRKAGRLRSGFDPDIEKGPIISRPLPNAAELVLEDLKHYLEGGNHREILEALLHFAWARGVTLEKCSKTGCTNEVTHWQQLAGGVLRLCDEHYHAILQTTWYQVEKSFPCSECGCQERATHRFQCDGVIRNMCAAHYNAMFKFLEPPNAEITLRDIRPTEKINLSVEVP